MAGSNGNGKRSALERFGGSWSWQLDGVELNIGLAIQLEGPGKGFAMLPWALDKYERVLRLRPGETWLLKRLLSHAWEYGGEAYLSLRRITFEANVTRKTLQSYMMHLERLGYVRFVAAGSGLDKRWRYDVSGTYAALALCIAADPCSGWAKAQGGPVAVADVRGLRHTAPHGKTAAMRFNLDFAALAALAARKGEELDVPADSAPQRRQTASLDQLGGEEAIQALGLATGRDYRKERRRLARELKLLGDLEPMVSADLLHCHYVKKDKDNLATIQRRPTWWYREDKRGQKGEAPAVATIRETWGKWQR